MNTCFLLSMPGFAELIIIGIFIICMVIWISAILDVARSKFDSDTTKIVWLLIVILTGVIGAVLYHFIGKQSKLNY